ncbi:SDR family NAD(P)-dependent oxidoreductase [Sulfidibacter corallicola]
MNLVEERRKVAPNEEGGHRRQGDPEFTREHFDPLPEVSATFYVKTSEGARNGYADDTIYGELQIAFGNLNRLEHAFNLLIKARPLLRSRRYQGALDILKTTPSYTLAIHDLRHRPSPEEDLERMRHRMETQHFFSGNWPLFEASCTRLNQDMLRFHLALDSPEAAEEHMAPLLKQLLMLYRDPNVDLIRLEREWRVIPTRAHEGENDSRAPSVPAKAAEAPPKQVATAPEPAAQETSEENRDACPDERAWEAAMSNTNWAKEAELGHSGVFQLKPERSVTELENLDSGMKKDADRDRATDEQAATGDEEEQEDPATLTLKIPNWVTDRQDASAEEEGSPESEAKEEPAETPHHEEEGDEHDRPGADVLLRKSDRDKAQAHRQAQGSEPPVFLDQWTDEDHEDEEPRDTPADTSKPAEPEAPAAKEPPAEAAPAESSPGPPPKKSSTRVDPWEDTVRMPDWLLEAPADPPPKTVRVRPKSERAWKPPENPPPPVAEREAEGRRATREDADPSTARAERVSDGDSRTNEVETEAPGEQADRGWDTRTRPFAESGAADERPRTWDTPTRAFDSLKRAVQERRTEDSTDRSKEPETPPPDWDVPTRSLDGAEPVDRPWDTRTRSLDAPEPVDAEHRDWDTPTTAFDGPDRESTPRPWDTATRPVAEQPLDEAHKANDSAQPEEAPAGADRDAGVSKDSWDFPTRVVSEEKTSSTPKGQDGSEWFATPAPGARDAKADETEDGASEEGATPVAEELAGKHDQPEEPTGSEADGREERDEEESWSDTLKIPKWVLGTPQPDVVAPEEPGPTKSLPPVAEDEPERTTSEREAEPMPEAQARSFSPESPVAEAFPAPAQTETTDSAESAQELLQASAIYGAAPVNPDTVDIPIAVVGMAGRYPRSPDLEMFWENLKAGRDCLSPLSSERSAGAPGLPPGKLLFGGFLDEIDTFDNELFNIPASEAADMDPQERIFLETVWATLENAGYTPESLKQMAANPGGGDVGVFAGVMYHDYFLLSGQALLENRSGARPGDTWSLANRVSRLFDFTGPSMITNTAGSSSLQAVHLACESLQRGRCQAAIAGGVNLFVHPGTFMRQNSFFFSAVGPKTGPGDGGDGFAPGEGVGAVLLKPLPAALVDGDAIYGVILSTASNHDGRAQGYGLPNAEVQAALVREALDRAGVSARTISYLEAHGAGTVLGDPIEITALSRAFGIEEQQFCALGSVKSNIGHLESAAGIAGLAKTLLQMKHRTLAPTLHANYLNPNIQFKESPFFVQRERVAWQRPQVGDAPIPLRAGVSAFGEGGTNVHVILEGPPEGLKLPPRKGPQIIALSAHTPETLREMVENMRRFVLRRMVRTWEGAPLDLANLAFTLQVGRMAMATRFATVVGSLAELEEKLRLFLQNPPEPRHEEDGDNPQYLDDPDLASRFSEDFHPMSMFRSGQLQRLADLWCDGVDIPWHSFYRHGERRRIHLPTYPFSRRRFWYQPPSDQPVETPAGTDTEPTDTEVVSQELGFFTKALVPAPTGREFSGMSLKGRFLLHTQNGIPESVMSDLMGLPDVTWTVVRKRVSGEERNPNATYLDFYDADTLQPNLENLNDLQGIIDVSDLQNDGNPAIPWGKIKFWRELLRRIGPRAFCLIHLTNGRNAITRAEASQAHFTSGPSITAGFVRMLAQEERHLKATTVDVDRLDDLVAVLRREIGTANADSEICYAGQLRLKPRFLARQEPTAEAIKLDPDKAYVISGGTGALGFALADHLVARGARRLVLMGIHPLPPRDFWQNLAERGEEPSRTKIRKLMDFEARGIKIKTYTGPLHEFDRLRLFFHQVRKDLGELDGVFHNAGPRERMAPFREKEIAELREAVEPRVTGLLALRQILDEEPFRRQVPRFFISFGSASLAAPDLASGWSGLFAADLFLDDFAAWQQQIRNGHDQGGIRFQHVGWGCWDLNPAAVQQVAVKRALGPMPTGKAVAALDQILGEGCTSLLALAPTRQFREAVESESGRWVSMQTRHMTTKIAKLVACLDDGGKATASAESLLEITGQVERFAVRLLFEALVAMGAPMRRGQRITADDLAHTLGIPRQRLSLLQDWLEVLQDAGLLNPKGKAFEVPDQAETMLLLLPTVESLLREHPDQAPHLEALRNAAEGLPSMLKTEPVRTHATLSWFGGRDTVLPADARDHGDLADLLHDQLEGVLKRLIASMDAADEKLRVLEIGARTTTRAVQLLDGLREHSDRLTYHWTRASSREVRQAADLLSDQYSFVRFAVLDLAVDPAKQGLEPGSFDLILARHELHGFRDLAATLQRIKHLLKRDGMLLFQEETRLRPSHRVLQSLAGRDSQAHQDNLRLPHASLLNVSRWRALLEACGFHHIASSTLAGNGSESGKAQGETAAAAQPGPTEYAVFSGFSDGAYWCDPSGFASQAHVRDGGKTETTLEVSEDEIDTVSDEPRVFFFSPFWQSQPLAHKTIKHLGPLLVMDHQDEQTTALRKEYPESVFLVRTGPSFRRLSDFVYRINPGREEDYHRLIHELGERGIVPGAVLHFWHFRMEDGERQIFHHPVQGEPYLQTQMESGLYSVFNFCRAWIRVLGNRRLRFLYIQGGSQARPQHEMLLGFMRSISHEYPNLSFKLVQRRGILSHNLSWIPNLLHELGDAGAEPIQVRFSDGRRQALLLQEVEPPGADVAREYPRKGGTYLVTGALGALGYPIAAFLAAKYRARLVLTGRKPMNELIEERIASLQIAGAEVLYHPADLSKAAEVEALVASAREQFGPIQGIVHAASCMESKPFADLMVKDVQKVLAPKLHGALHLDLFTREDPLDFFLLISSAAAWFGAAQLAAFAGANTFLDAFAAFRNGLGGERPGRTVSLCWPLWGELTPEAVSAEVPDPSLPEAVGQAIFEDCLALRRSRVLALYGNPSLVRGFARFESENGDDMALPDSIKPGDLATFLRHLIGEEDRENAKSKSGLATLDRRTEQSMRNNLAEDLNTTLRDLLREHRTVKEVTDFIESNEKGFLKRLLQSHQKPEPAPAEPSEATEAPVEAAPVTGIAIIGLSANYPDAPNLDRFWSNLSKGDSAIATIPADRWDHHKLEREQRVTCHWGGFLDRVHHFDHELFGIERAEAERMDVGERLLLQASWALLEDAGYTRNTLDGFKREIGVFVAGTHDPHPDETGFGHSLWLIADRISSYFDLHGPSMPVDTGSSSSLTALHLAKESLRRGECRAAIVAGINLYLHPERYRGLSALGLLSQDGKTHSFCMGGKGFVPGEGVGALLLKPAAEALEDGDHIYAIIKGTSVSHRGRGGTYITPSLEAQAEVVGKVLEQAKVEPTTISSIEAQGFGAHLGDAVEVAGLARAFGHRRGESQYCALSSLKPNIGHLEAASGIAALTKMALQLHRERLLPNRSEGVPNPELDLRHTPFYIQTEPQHWPQLAVGGAAQPRRGLVTAAGAGGANACAVLEEYPGGKISVPEDTSRQGNAQLILLSARTPEQLRLRADRLVTFLEDRDRQSLPRLQDIAHTLQVGREHFEHRLALLIDTTQHLVTQLTAFLKDRENQVQVGQRGGERVFGLSMQDRAYLKGLADGGHLGQLAALWLQGAEVDWRILQSPGRLVSLPTYPFHGEEIVQVSDEVHAETKLTPSLGHGPTRRDLTKVDTLYRMLETLAEGRTGPHAVDSLNLFQEKTEEPGTTT